MQGITHSYDANGNLTGDGTNSWVYDVENRPVAARGLYAANLRYDPLGRLHETVTNVDDGIPANDITVRRLYDGGALIAEYDQTGALLRRFVHGPNTGADTPLVWYEGPTMSQAAARMLNTDLQGSVTSVTDFNGNPIAINRYDEYGRPQSGNLGRFQYTGQAWLPEIGLYYYKARMYSPTLGQFMQTDPIGYADGVNWYNYVGGDPVNFVDPSGLWRECYEEDRSSSDSEGNITVASEIVCRENDISSAALAHLIAWWKKYRKTKGPEILGSVNGDSVLPVPPDTKTTCPGSDVESFTASIAAFRGGDVAHLHNPDENGDNRENQPGPDDGQNANGTGVSYVGTRTGLYIVQSYHGGRAYSIGLIAGSWGSQSIINYRIQSWNRNAGKEKNLLQKDISSNCTTVKVK